MIGGNASRRRRRGTTSSPKHRNPNRSVSDEFRTSFTSQGKMTGFVAVFVLLARQNSKWPNCVEPAGAILDQTGRASPTSRLPLGRSEVRHPHQSLDEARRSPFGAGRSRDGNARAPSLHQASFLPRVPSVTAGSACRVCRRACISEAQFWRPEASQ